MPPIPRDPDRRAGPPRAVARGDQLALELDVLGEIEVVGGGGRYAPGGSRPGAMLALLAIRRGERLAVEELIEELWPRQAQHAAVKRVHVNVLRLRRGLAGAAPGVDPATIVRTCAGGYALALEAIDVDALRVERSIARGRALLRGGDPARAAAALRAALSLWRGRPYADVAYESFAADEVRRLEQLRVDALESWVEAELALGRHAAMVSELERLTAVHPLREHLRALEMLALYRCGRQSDALEAFRAARAALVERLGVEPGAELHALQRAILEQRPALDCAATVPAPLLRAA